MNEDRIGADSPMVGLVGTLVIGCRGQQGPGELELSIRGGREYFTAHADEPLAAGTRVLVIESLPHRAVTVVAWHDPGAFSPLA